MLDGPLLFGQRRGNILHKWSLICTEVMQMPEDKPTEKNVQVRVPAELAQRIDQLAKAEKRSRSNWLRLALDQVVSMQKNEQASSP